MPAGEVLLLDILDFLAVQRDERYKAFVIHSPVEKDVERRSFASRLAQVQNGKYVDVLALVASDATLSQTIDLIDASYLRQVALDACADGTQLVVLDEFDFLIPVWGNELSGLRQMISTLSRTDTPSVVVFTMQTRSSLDSWHIVNSRGESRVLSLSDIKSLS